MEVLAHLIAEYAHGRDRNATPTGDAEVDRT